MVCEFENYAANPQRAREEMARTGWSPEQIAALEAEIELAKRKAEAESFSRGDTREEQLRAIDRALRETVKELHDREHRKREDDAKAISDMAEFRKKHPGHHYNPNRGKVKVTSDGEEDK